MNIGLINDAKEILDDLKQMRARLIKQLGPLGKYDGWNLKRGRNPEARSTYYDVVIPALLAGNVPENMTVLISIWHKFGVNEFEKVKNLPNVKAFVYDDNYKYGFVIDTYCKAYDEHGKLDHNITCDKCKKCFNRLNNCKVIGCKAH